MIGHVGSRVGALVDGQLPAAEAERLWAHVHACARCRAKVEHEGWAKTQLAGLASTWPATAPLGLRASLADACSRPDASDHLACPGRPLDDHRGLLAVAVLGAGSIGVAMVGVIAFSVGADAPGDRRVPTASIPTPTSLSVPARTDRSEP